MSRNHQLPAGRPLPPKYRFMFDIGFHQKFTWRQRWQILLGYHADISLKIATEHHAGKFEAQIVFKTIKELQAPNRATRETL